MHLLPVIGRELQCQARSRTMRSVRLGAGLVGLVVSGQMLGSYAAQSPASVGRTVFNAIIGAALLGGLGSCLLTAESIARERRDQTLGLLFLTDVGSAEVLLAKLASAGLTVFGALIGLVPALAFPVLAGGVEPGEILRKGVALLAAAWVGMGAGLLAATLQRDRKRILWSSLLAVGLLALVPLAAWKASSRGVIHFLGLLSPVTLTMSASERVYSRGHLDYWVSLGLAVAVGLALVVGAGLLLHRIVLLDAEATTQRRPKAEKESKRELGFGRWKPEKEDSDPIEWLVFRGRGVGVGLWLVAVLGLVMARTLALMMPLTGAGRPGAGMLTLLIFPMGLGTGLLAGGLLAHVAGSFFARVRTTGELELLLTSPVGAKTLLVDQWRVLARVFIWPVLVLQGAIVLALLLMIGRGMFPGPIVVVALGVNLLATGFSVTALCWLAMRFGLSMPMPLAGTVLAALIAQGAPWLVVLLTGRMPLLPDIVLLVVYVFQIRWARKGLFAALRNA